MLWSKTLNCSNAINTQALESTPAWRALMYQNSENAKKKLKASYYPALLKKERISLQQVPLMESMKKKSPFLNAAFLKP